MSVEQNKATERRLYDEVWNKGNMSIVPELVSPEYLYRGPSGDFKGPKGFAAMVTGQRTAMPDLHYMIDDMVGEGDKLAYRITGHGTYTGKMGDVDIKGKKLTWTQALFVTFKDGKVAGAVN